MSSHEISVVLPAYNEADNLKAVITELRPILARGFDRWQILVVDDGSTDDTRRILSELQEENPELAVITQRRNFGKSEALRVAFEAVDADLVALMDADGQDDPSELNKMLVSIEQGFDLVTGRRSIRNDRFVKRATSRFYNWCTAKVSGVDGRDFNSGFKLMRGEVVDDLDMYGEMHRYIPPLAEWAGYRSVEVDVNHRERLAGHSKFGRARFWRGFFDLITVKFLTTYDSRPFHLIGSAGVLCGLIGSMLLVWMAIEKLQGNGIGTRPALTTGVLLVVVSVQLISVGLLAELFVHHTRRQKGGRGRR
ncbi:MAG: glycosyltransferase family 2 protein [Actinomycetia bacterium]|nr:glycosyltransferase family 2 protein [Actinomycetes bacterium]MCP5032880.1 glycosyltransferase family 2 protein [Actinomycetes bacterium]